MANSSFLERRNLCLTFISAALLFTGCITPQTQLQSITEGLTTGSIQVLETENFRVHYPEGHRDGVLRILSAGEFCVAHLKEYAEIKDTPINVIFVNKPIENAFYSPNIQIIIPLNFIVSANDDALLPGCIFCHELVHYVQGSQISGVPAFMEKIFGRYFFRPQFGLESWVWEGIAIYYESKLGYPRGRLNDHFWRQVFESKYAHQPFTGSDLFKENRETYQSEYLSGSHFIEYLAKTYGEDKIWSWVKAQGDAILWPLGIGYRFENAFGISLAQAIEDFSAQLSRTLQKRQRPSGQTPVAEKIQDIELPFAAHPSGKIAYLTYTQEQDSQLTILDSNGELHFQRPIPDVVPPRTLLYGRPLNIFFSHDGSALFVAFMRVMPTEQNYFDLYKIDVTTGNSSVIFRESNFIGDAVSQDGKLLFGHRSNGVVTEIIERPAENTQDGRERVLLTLPVGYSLSQLTLTPKGTKLALLVHSPTDAKILQFPLAPNDAQTGGELKEIPLPENTPNRIYGFSFVDDSTLIFSRPDDKRVQVYSLDLLSGQSAKITDAPYLALHPKMAGNNLLFMNREIDTFSIDKISRPARENEPSRIPEGKKIALKDTSYLAQKSLPQLNIRSEESYSKTDGLFNVRSWFPSISLGSQRSFGATLSGNDDLYLHAWVVGAKYLESIGKTNFQFGYKNLFLSPISIQFSGSQNWEPAPQENNTPITDQSIERMRSFALITRRPVFSAVTSLSFFSLDRELPFEPEKDLRLIGPSLGFQWQANRSTGYTDKLGLMFATNLSHYDKIFGSKYSLSDIRSEFGFSWQPPLSKHHELRHFAKARALVNPPEGSELLRVGGSTKTILSSSRPLFDSSTDATDSFLRLRPELRESISGFEDISLAAQKLVVAGNKYTYVYPVNSGAAYPSFLPSYFIKTTSLALFSSHVFRNYARPDLALGSVAQANFSFSQIPMNLSYQWSVRPKTDKNQLHLLQLGVEM